MLYVTRLIEPWMEAPPESCIKRFRNVRYTARCTTCSHQCTLTFNNPSVSLYAEDEKLAGALSLLCERLAKADREDLDGTLHRIFVVRGE